MGIDASPRMRLRAPSQRPRILDIALVGLLIFVIVALTTLNVLNVALAGFVLAALALAALAKPQTALYIFAFSVPFESSVLFTGPVGTISKATGLLLLASFIVHRWRTAHPAVLPVSLWVWTAWALLSQVGIPTDSEYTSISTLLQLIVMVFLVAAMVRQEPAAGLRAGWSFVAGSATVALIGVAAYLSSTPSGASRAAAFTGQSVAHFAASMIPLLIFGLWLVVGQRRTRILSHKATPWVGVIFVALATTAMLISGTRSSWIGAIVGAVVLLWLGTKGGGRTVVTSAAVVLGVVALLATLVWTIPRVNQLIDQRLDTAVSSGGAGRVNTWAVGLAIARDNPVLGVGYGQFEVRFTTEAIQSPLFESEIYKILPEGRAAHSVYLEILTELGIIGLALWLVFLYGLINRRARERIPIPVLAVLAAYLSQGFFLDILNRKYFWMFVAIAIAFTAKEKWTSGDNVPKPSVSVPHRSLRRRDQADR